MLAVAVANSAVAAEIEEIVVTARAVDESVRDVPMAISAFTEEQLQRFAIRDLEDLAASSASLESGEAVFSTPINDRWGVRLAIQGTGMSDGYLNNVAGPTTYTPIDAAAGFTPTVHENGPAAGAQSHTTDGSRHYPGS